MNDDAMAPIEVIDHEVPPQNGSAMAIGQWTGPDEVRALQKALKAHLEVLRSALQRCAAAGTFTPTTHPGAWDAWQGLKTRVENYIAEDAALLSTASQYERGELLQKELASWHVRAKEYGCDAGPAPMLPDPSTPLFSTAGLTQTGLILLAIVWLMHQSDK